MKKIGILFVCQLSLFCAYAQKIDFKKINDTIYIYTTYKKMDRSIVSANGLAINTKLGCVLIDAPWSEKITKQLIEEIYKRFNDTILFCIITHAHEDRIGGIDPLKKYKIPAVANSHVFQHASEKKYTLPDSLVDNYYQWSNLGIEILYPGKGHTYDNTVVYLKDTKILFGGCLIKSMEHQDLGYIQDAYLDDWILTVKKCKEKYPEIKLVIPGHGKIGGTELFHHTINLIQQEKIKK